VHRFGQGGQGLDPMLGKRSAAQPWRWHNADNMCTTRVCAHTTPGQIKAGPSLDGGVLSVWVSTASRNSACARRDKARHDCKARERARRRRQWHLQSDRLGSMTGSQATVGLRGGASWQRATLKQRAHKARSSLGSKVGSTTRSGGFLTSRSWTRRRRRRGEEQQNDLEQKQGGVVHGFMASSVLP
jgi:hypothetical protein